MEGARIVLAGEYQKMQQTFRFQAMGMAGAVLLIYFLMVALFRSYLTPLVVLSAVPVGVAAAIYLEEYAPKNWLTTLIEVNVTNLAGVPSIVYGLLALGLFVYQFDLGQSILTAGLTLSLLILPIVIVATRESLRAVPRTIREAAYALGAWVSMAMIPEPEFDAERCTTLNAPGSSPAASVT